MSRQLNLRVDESFADGLERLSQKLGRSMASVLESIGKPAIEAAEADLQFEIDALAAWEEYELTGVHVSAESIENLFEDAHQKASLVAKNRDICQEK